MFQYCVILLKCHVIFVMFKVQSSNKGWWVKRLVDLRARKNLVGFYPWMTVRHEKNVISQKTILREGPLFQSMLQCNNGGGGGGGGGLGAGILLLRMEYFFFNGTNWGRKFFLTNFCPQKIEKKKFFFRFSGDCVCCDGVILR